MGSRLELQTLLQSLIGVRPDEKSNVYFQPPESMKMNYPCIVYSISGGDTQFADDNPYIYETRYQVIVIDKNPDSLIPKKIAMLSKCLFDRHYKSNNLNHFAYNLYY